MVAESSLWHLDRALQRLGRGATHATWHVDFEDGRELAFRADEPVPAASMIKLHVAHALHEAQPDWNDQLVIEPALRAGGDGLLAAVHGSTMSVWDLTVLMLALSDNWATNLLIDHLGGLDHVNSEFDRLGLDAGVKKYFYVPEPVAEAQADTAWNDGEVGQGWTTARSSSGSLRHLAYVDARRAPFISALAHQQDRRSALRWLSPSESVLCKTGTAYGLRHCSIGVRSGGGVSVATVLTESRIRREFTDHPALRQLAAVAERFVVQSDGPTAPARPLVPDDLDAIIDYLETVRSTLRSLDSEIEFWRSVVAGGDERAFAIGADEVVALGCFYGLGTADPSIGVYIVDEARRSSGLFSTVIDELERRAALAGSTRLVANVAVDNSRSLSAFTGAHFVPRSVGSVRGRDEVRLERDLNA